MQYCIKCKKICEDQNIACPHCKRSRTLRNAKDDDMVFFLKTTEYEAMELEDKFVAHGVNCEIRAFKTGIMSSVYDSSVMPTDKEIFVRFSDILLVKQILRQEEKDEPIEIDEPLSPKMVGKHFLMVGAFFGAIALFVLLAISIGNLF